MMGVLADKVAALPEVYQPIFGHPELAAQTSRDCCDRLRHVSPLLDEMCHKLGRQVRILDLGCAQGFISLSLAATGASVVGVDYLAANVEVCSALAAEHSDWALHFQHARLEEFICGLDDDSFDLVLGLSVFHHVAYEHGFPATRQLLDRLAACVSVGVFELAQATEPLYWAEAQPRDSREFLGGFAFVHEVARFPTHLSDIQRPLYVASNRYWYLGGVLNTFAKSTTDPHAMALGTYQLSRRYFFGKGCMAKVQRLDGELGESNRLELRREIEVLGNPPAELANSWPSLDSFGETATEGWLVREMIDGQLLLDAIARGDSYDPHRVIGDVLEQLAVLERYGYYHNDVRVWNVLLHQDGSSLLIDYGSISHESMAGHWPSDLFLTFFSFVHETVKPTLNAVSPYRVPPFVSPFSLPAPYSGWLKSLWVRPRSEWSFHALLDSFVRMQPSDRNDETHHEEAESLWSATMEQYLCGLGSEVFSHGARLAQLTNRDTDSRELLKRKLDSLDTLRRDSDNRLRRIATLEQEKVHLHEQWQRDLAELDALRHDSDNRLRRIAMLEQENALQKGVQNAQQAERGELRRLREADASRIVELERDNAVQSGSIDNLRAVIQQGRHELAQAHEQQAALAQHASRLDRELHEQVDHASRAEHALQELMNSRSWRWTRPIRTLRRWVKPLDAESGAASEPFPQAIQRGRARAAIRRAVRRAIKASVRRPLIRRLGAGVLMMSPKLKAKLVAVALDHPAITLGAGASSANPLDVLHGEGMASPTIDVVYQRLHHSVELSHIETHDQHERR